MSIFILALILIGCVGALGRQVGAIRMGVSMLGAIVAFVGAIFLTPILSNYVPLIGIKHPVSIWAYTPLIAFFGIFVAMNGVAQGVFFKVSAYYKFRAKDDVRMRWERMDTNVGLSVGLVAGCVHLMIVSVPIYVAGNVTTQVDSPSGNPFLITLLNRTRRDLESTGFDKLAAALAPKNDKLYEMAEVAGLIYHNKSLQSFLAEYPLYYSVVEDPSMASKFGIRTPGAGNQQGADDPNMQPPADNSGGGGEGEAVGDFPSLFQNQSDVTVILKHPTTAELIANSEFMALVEQTDMADLKTFLTTGKSPKYSQEPLVGKWKIDIVRTARDFGEKNSKAGSAAMRTIRGIVNAGWKDVTLIVSPDGRAYLKGGKGNFPNFSQWMQVRLTPQLLQQIALRGNPPLRQLASGTWTLSGETVTMQLTGGSSSSGKAALTSGHLQFDYAGSPIVMYKYL